MGFHRDMIRAFGMMTLCAFAWMPVARGADGWLSRAWQTDEGLTDNSVTGVAQGSDGYLWVATRGGLLRFNGEEFEEMPISTLPGVPNRVVRSMLIGRSGRMWLAMERGPVVSLGKEDVRNFAHADGLPDAQVVTMTEDREGVVWIAYSNSLGRIAGGKCTSWGVKDGLPRGGGAVWTGTDGKGEMWFSKGNQIGRVRDGKLWVELTFKDSPVRFCAKAGSGLRVCAGNRIFDFDDGHEPVERGRLPEGIESHVMLEDGTGALWIGTAASGLFRIVNGVPEQVPTSHQAVDCLAEDREGTIWVGTNGGGLDQVRSRAMSVVGRKEGLPAESVRSVCEDTGGGLWATLQNGKLARDSGGRWEEVGDWPGGNATSVASDRQGGVYVGTRDQGLRHFHKGKWTAIGRGEGLAGDSVRSILVDQKGDGWIATDSPRRLQRLHAGSLETMKVAGEIRSIRAMAEGADGTIWIGTAEGQLFRVVGNSLRTETAGTDATTISIRSLHATPDGALWIGYAGSGVGRLKDGKYGRITKATGLPDDYASQVFPDGKDGMWIVGNHGLFQVSLKEMTAVAEGRLDRVRARVFGRNDGIVSLPPSYDYYPSVCRARDGKLWFASRSGLLVVEPAKVRDNPVPPPVVIERVAVDDSPVAAYDGKSPLRGRDHLLDPGASSKVLRLAPGHRKLEFSFAALSFISPENCDFRCRLSDFDKDWINIGKEHNRSYPQLPAGDYTFRVTASNNAGVWNPEGAKFEFTVLPFFWQTWWFRTLALGAFTAGVIAIVRYVSFRRLRGRMLHLKQQAALHNERARIARDMHDEVGAKLTRLSILSEMVGGQTDLSPAAQSEVREISETARETILAFDEIVWAVNPRNDTLGDLTHYLCRHAEEFFEGTQTDCVFDLPRVMPTLMLSTEARHQVFLASKEALNNVLKHANASQVTIRLLQNSSSFDLVIEDDGRGIDPDAPVPPTGGGNGLVNLRERMVSIGGQFDCRSVPGQGTRVTFTIPTS